MFFRNVLLCSGLAWLASAAPAPLNINLGAYSPALVVGDGAIGFTGAEAGRAAEAVIGAEAAPATTGGAGAGQAVAGEAGGAQQGGAAQGGADAVGDGQQAIAASQVRTV